MSITISGDSLVWDGTVTITNFTDSSTGVCTLILTPNGGVGTLPALAQGAPGLPPIFTLGTVTTLSAGQQASIDLEQTSAGGSGSSSEYTISFSLPQGEAGTSGETTIGSATDLSGSAAVGDIVTVKTVTSGTPTFQYTVFPWGNVYNSTSFSTVSKTGQNQGTLATISIPAQGSAWYPIVFASCIVNGTVNTVVSLQALINSATTGQVCGEVLGLAGTANQRLTMLPAFGSQLSESDYGLIAAGDGAEIYLIATESATVSDSWTVNDTAVTFTVVTVPVSS